MPFELSEFFKIYKDYRLKSEDEITFVSLGAASANETKDAVIWLKNISPWVLKTVRVSVEKISEAYVRADPPLIPEIKIGEAVPVKVIWTCKEDQKEPLQTKLFISGSFIKVATRP
jgi:hypothetical protein